jgi:O-antigen/teichoic acid export membrane protein
MVLLVGGVVAQLIPLAASPLLAHLYTPEDFGVLALFMSFVSILSVVATGRYELAILNPPEDRDGLALLVLACTIATVACGAVWIAVAGSCLVAPGSSLCSGPGMAREFTWLVPLAALSAAGLSALTTWANRNKDYRRIAAVRVVQSGITAVASIGLGFAALGAAGLIGAVVAAQWLAIALLGSFVLSRSLPVFRTVSWARIGHQARQQIAFPMINLPHALLDNVQTVAVIGALSLAFGIGTTGLFAFMQRIMRAPLLLLGASMGQVFQQQVSAAHHEREPLRPLVLAQLRSLARWAVLFVLIAPFAPWLFATIFGESWREAGVYGLILTPWMVANFLVSPLSQLPLLLGRQRGALLYGLAYQAALLAPCVLALLGYTDARGTFALQSAGACLILAVYGRWLVRISDR